MPTIQRTEIPINKKKQIGLLFSCLIFVAIGVMMFFVEPSSGRHLLNIPAIRYGVAVVSILFFGFAALILLKQLKENRPGLILDERGITDSSSSMAARLILWSDIQKFTEASVMNQKFLIIVVNNPNDYIDQQSNALKKRGLKYNLNNFGSPIAIAANTLKIKLPQLKALLEEKLVLSRIS